MTSSRFSSLRNSVLAAAVVAVGATPTLAQSASPSPFTGGGNVAPEVSIAGGLNGRTVERIDIRGNVSIPTTLIQNVIRSRVGQPLDPLTVSEDYQAIYGLRKFANVVARLEPTETGVVIVYVVTEQRTVRSVGVRGNDSGKVQTDSIMELVEIRPGQGIDNYRIALVRRSIEQLYQSKNFPYARVAIDSEALSERGELIFVITEGPNVVIRNIDFIGNHSFPEGELKKKVQSKVHIFLIRPGTLNEETLEDDVGALKQFYQGKGFFDVKVGRRVVMSPDQRRAQVEYVIDEGPRYRIEKITFVGNQQVSEAQFREDLKLLEGAYFDQEVVDRDVQKIVDNYAPTGMIYEPSSNDPDFLTVEPQRRFRLEPGSIELVYAIDEGKPFELGNIEVRGNTRTQQKVVLREFRGLEPGELFNATEVRKGEDRTKATRLFDRVRVTPIGNDPEQRDLLVEVEESKTALLTFGAGISSNGGISGNATYTQRNFDIARWPDSFRSILNEDALVGAGQTFRVSLEPGTEVTQATLSWREPWLFDQPYSLQTDFFIRDRRRDEYREGRGGGKITFGKRFTDVYSASLSFRGEDVRIHSIEDKPVRAFEILDRNGNTTLTSIGITGRRDTTNIGPLAYEGTVTQVGWESYGGFGEDTFQKLTASFDWYQTLGSDLLDRRTVLALRLDTGYITGDSPFFERFYGGGLGSLRGFSFRGVSPRSGPADDAIGGEFSLLGSAEISFPVYTDTLRGVVFIDAGTVEEEVRLGTLRSAAGFGIRLTLPIIGQVPIAVDYAVPLTSDEEDEQQRISFSLGIIP
jgi:outer membrane protein insertion porin family